MPRRKNACRHEWCHRFAARRGTRQRSHDRLAYGLALLFACAQLRLMAQPPDAKTLSIDRIAAERDRAAALGTQFAWSPDGKKIAFIRSVAGASGVMHGPQASQVMTAEIGAIDTATGRQSLLATTAQVHAALAPKTPKPLGPENEEDARRSELQSFAWSPDSRSLLLAGISSMAWFDLDSKSSRPLVAGDEELSAVQLSPGGRFVSFVRNHALSLAGAATGKIQAFAGQGADDLREGEPDWVYAEEFHLRAAYWWSPDSASLAWLETDDRKVGKYSLRAADGEEEQLAFPKPGGALPSLSLLVRPISAAKPLRIDLTSNPAGVSDAYIPEVQWLPDGKHLAVERLSRGQKTLDLLLVDAATGRQQTLLTEKDAYWINSGGILRFLPGGHRFLWSSERSGFRHLYLYELAGNAPAKLIAQLTHGDWEVSSLAGVDATAAYITATEASVLERQLYRVRLNNLDNLDNLDNPDNPKDGSHSPGLVRLTQEKGTHDAVLSPRGDLLLDTYSTQSMPPHRELLRLDGTAVGAATPPLPSPASLIDDRAASQLPSAEFLIVKSHMGLEMHASLIKPANFDPAKRYPVLFYVAGGPGEQIVRDRWGGDIGLWMRSMALNGYAVFALDNRGTAARGHLFEESIHLRFSASEMADIRDGVLYLQSLPWIDKGRVGICGWGFGGFLALHGMLDRPLSFKAGFAGEPISDWHLYNAVFTERYLESPVHNQDGWLASSPVENARFLNAPLLLAQATLDPKIHPENSLLVLDELLDRGKYADILLFADRRDLFEDKGSRRILFGRLTEFFLKNL